MDAMNKLLLFAALALAGCGGSGGSGGSIDPAAVFTYFGGAYNGTTRVGPAVVYLGNPDASIEWLDGANRTTDTGTWRKWTFSGSQNAAIKFTPDSGVGYDMVEVTLPSGMVLKCAADRTAPYELPGF